MPRSSLQLLMSSYDKATARSAAPQKLKNVFLEEYMGYGNQVRYSAYPTPGITSWVTFPVSGGTIRGQFVHNDLLYIVVDTKVYKVTTAGSYTELGTVDTAPDATQERVSIVGTNDYIIFCVSQKVWTYQISTGIFAQVTDADFPYDEVSQAIAFGETVLYLITDSQTIYISDLSNPTAVRADNFFNSEALFDNLVGGAVAQNFLYLFGTVTTEVYYFSGEAIVPFTRVGQGAINYGAVAKNSIHVLNNEVFFLAQDVNGLVGLMKFSGVQPTLVGNRAFNEKLRGYSRLDTALAWVDNHNAHQFYNLTFPNKDASRTITHSYDITTDIWLEREIWNPDAFAIAGYEGHIAQTCVYFNNKQYIGSRYQPTIYEISMDISNDAGYPSVHEITTPYLNDNDSFICCTQVEVDVERSVALATGQGSEPELTLTWTTDRWGTSFSETLTTGLIGEYRNRIIFGSLGGGYSFGYKISWSDPVPLVIHGITAVIESENKVIMNGA